MWVLFLAVMSFPKVNHYDSTISVTSHTFTTKEACVQAVKFSKERKYVADA